MPHRIVRFLCLRNIFSSFSAHPRIIPPTGGTVMRRYFPAICALLIAGILSALSATLWMLLTAPDPDMPVSAGAHFVYLVSGGML